MKAFKTLLFSFTMVMGISAYAAGGTAYCTVREIENKSAHLLVFLDCPGSKAQGISNQKGVVFASVKELQLLEILQDTQYAVTFKAPHFYGGVLEAINNRAVDKAF